MKSSTSISKTLPRLSLAAKTLAWGSRVRDTTVLLGSEKASQALCVLAGSSLGAGSSSLLEESS
eukprot:CAMPEP_0184288174 /NCGR_PEP_ID=MMETSP1049-20130417/670_1 /TAXON_ID=77928 /ORGANISM="Proteomonas sulcata, Strain CCMP704" /LENGTH=63 /DNA_ID=CAMNT_0026594405 /DNA_START=802 /DNA_END=989 /DNA_ORIENTATION=+